MAILAIQRRMTALLKLLEMHLNKTIKHIDNNKTEMIIIINTRIMYRKLQR